jgi:DHA1 family tetracycline resistance protein-like MFS transporter
MVGLTLAGVGICAMVVQGGLVGPAVAHFGDRTALIVGLLFGAVGFFVYGIAESGTVFLLGVPLMALWGLASPSAQGLMSRRVSASEQGQLQGANASIMGIASMIGPGIFTLTFARAIEPGVTWQQPGAPFLLAALLLALAAVVAWRATRRPQ